MTQREMIHDFIEELSGFVATAEQTLNLIESDMEANKHRFSIFSERMLAIRGTAEQLALPQVSRIARLAEEIAVKGASAESRPQIRKCTGALWDALTTIKHLLVNHGKETGEEQAILINRLEATLRAFGGARETFMDDEITALIERRNRT